MNHVSLDAQADNVQQFVLSLAGNHAGTVLESRGQPVACVVPVATEGGPAGEWTDEKNQRRCDLIDRKYEGAALTPEELVELARLNEELDRHIDRVAPLPLEATRKLHQELLMQAGKNLSR